jgi:large subunit ribosomal protein L4
VRPHLFHAEVRRQLAQRRAGTHSTKNRSAVSGGGAKPWRQKGTGRARAGSIRAPHWTGGGIAFGPSPRRYTLKTNRKARKRALRAALSVHAQRGSIAVIDASAFQTPSTSTAAETLESWDSKAPVLVLLTDDEVGCAKSFRNIGEVEVLEAHDAGVADVIGAASLVLSSAALEALSELTKGRG